MKASVALLLSISAINADGAASFTHASPTFRAVTPLQASKIDGDTAESNVSTSSSSNLFLLDKKAGVLDQALGFLTGASLVYLYAELRQLCYAGFTVTEFDDIDCNSGNVVTAQSVMAVFLRERFWAVAVDKKKALEPGEEFRDDEYTLDVIQNSMTESIQYGTSLIQGTPRENTEKELEEEISKLADRVDSSNKVAPPRATPIEDEDVVAGAEKITGKLFKKLLARDAATDEFPDTGNKKLIALIKEFSSVYMVPGSMLTGIFTDDVELVYFSDRYPQKDCVWGITINHTQKQITVIFRGSVNANDWSNNLQIVQDEVPNPVKGMDLDEIGMHFGFHAFLQRKRMNGKYANTFEEIMAAVQTTFDKVGADGDWRFAVTGHSLGAALASVFGFYAAADGRFNTDGRSIEIFSFASPYVGDRRYRTAFKQLEKDGKLRHARFCNKHDVVTYEPSLSPNIDFSKIFRISEWNIGFYHHVGLQIQLMLEDDKPASILYPSRDNFVADFKRGLNYFLPFSLQYAFDFGLFHSVGEYERRIKAERTRVATDSLNVPLTEYYEREGIVKK